MHYFAEEKDPMAPDPDTLRHTLEGLRDHEREQLRQARAAVDARHAAGDLASSAEASHEAYWHGGRLDLLERLLSLTGPG